MDNSWLQYQIPEIESPCCVPLLAQMHEGDELWTYLRPKEIGHTDEEAGIALVRNGAIVAHVVAFND